MFTNSGSIEAGEGRYDIIAAQSFVDVDPFADPEQIIEKQPGLFAADWDGPSEVVAIIDEHRVAAAGVLRFCFPDPETLEAYVVGEVGEGVDPSVLKAALRERVKERRATMAMSEDGTTHPVHTTVHWGSEPPALNVSPESSRVGVKGYKDMLSQKLEAAREREAARKQFLEDLMTPNGPLTF